MPIFVHIADARDSAAIRRSGLTVPKARWRSGNHGVFAMPVIDDFMITHQWVRELARRGHRSAVGIYFRVPDDEPVLAGRFNEAKSRIAATEAAARLRADRILGYEVIIPRSIKPGEIHAIRTVPPIGWRFAPEAKGAAPRCVCDWCTGGKIKGKRLRDRFAAS